ncbi:MAG: DUF896 domain-containing protein [Oscillospiraceae bacterium]|nr:DUF896 domain-containing protein [Oscillospiraceae bacterium]
MEQCKLDRISELTRLSRERELTNAEQTERHLLREEYLAEWRNGAKQTLDRVYIVDEKGIERKLTK